MAPILLTKSTTFIIGPVAELIGYIMNGIFYILGRIGLPNIGLAIIIMTILIYMCMLPLTIRQQKFSKLQRKMQPEINKIQKNIKEERTMLLLRRSRKKSSRSMKNMEFPRPAAACSF